MVYFILVHADWHTVMVRFYSTVLYFQHSILRPVFGVQNLYIVVFFAIALNVQCIRLCINHVIPIMKFPPFFSIKTPPG